MSRSRAASQCLCTCSGTCRSKWLWLLGRREKHWGLVKGFSYPNHSRDTFAGAKDSALVPLRGSLFCLYILEQDKSLVGVMAYSYSHNTQEAEVGRFPQVQDQPGVWYEREKEEEKEEEEEEGRRGRGKDNDSGYKKYRERDKFLFTRDNLVEIL